MKVKEIFEKNYAPKISVSLDDVIDEDKNEVASMLRGLLCAIEGWGKISGLTNDLMTSEGVVVLTFSSVDNAHYFKNCVEYYFAEDILKSLRLKKRIYRS